jgi:putative spermidine/putrescine transport system substrate-binding protein
MNRILMCACGIVVLFTACTDRGAPRNPKLVVVSYGGGSYQQSQIEAFERPFSSSHHVDVEPVVWGAEYGKLEEMVESGNVPWDVVEVTAAQFVRGRGSLFQPLTRTIPISSFDPIDKTSAPDHFGVPNVYWSTVLGYKKSAFLKEQPAGWRDFWDVKRFPGPRALYDNPRATLEFALLSSGVQPNRLYPLDVDRAFALLDNIRPYVRLWWTDGTQPVSAMLTGTVVMSPAWSGRLYASQQAGQEIGYTWNGAANELDYWIIPKGSKNVSLANDFIVFASDPDAMAKQATLTAYGPANKLAVLRVPGHIRLELPTDPQNWAVSFIIDSDWWSKNEVAVTERWLRWKSK